ncbi:MAG: AEC family transporter [Spirochaetaceae bacterium]|nr:AEC family transporter [Spirochaetaceae bacterium]
MPNARETAIVEVMADFFNGVQGVLTILLMIAVGFILGRRKWFSDETVTAMSRLVVGISLPAMLFSSVVSTFTRQDIFIMGPSILVPLAVASSLYGLAAIVAIIFRVPANRRGVFRACFAFANTIFIGVPVNIALFGEQAVPYVTLYYLGNTAIFWTLGVYFIRRDNPAQRFPVFSRKTLAQIFSPSLIAFSIALLFVMFELRLPSFFMASLKYIAALLTPLAILIIGITLKPESLRRITPEIALILAARFVLAPAVVFFLVGRTNLPLLLKNVFFITAAMPSMTQIPLIAKAYGADHQSSGTAATVTTTVSLLVIPVYMILPGA